MKSPVEIFYQTARVLAIAALIAGFEISRHRLGTIITLTFAFFWLITRRYLQRWLPPVRLVGFVAISVWSMLLGAGPAAPLAGVTFALACWELDDRSSKEAAGGAVNPFEVFHLKWLGITGLIGLILSEACSWWRVSLPFEVILISALLVLYGVYQLFNLFRSRQDGRIE